jgi:NAD(P)-dependent dehydrogenase (short-subunit alcohol dehydrogenase family)
MPNVLITGANRGIGLELARQLQEGGWTIYAVCRKASPELSAITPHILEGLDLSENDVVDQLRERLEADTLEVVINCAGLLESNGLDTLDLDSVLKQFQINAMGPLRVIKAVVDRMPEGGKVIMVTSRMGSIADNTSGGSYGYRMSKAALNIASVSLAHDLKSRGIAVGILHPGYVKTGMTKFSGHIEPEESARGMLKRMEELSLENTGTFLHQNGEVLPW